jgi:hypothetical protein
MDLHYEAPLAGERAFDVPLARRAASAVRVSTLRATIPALLLSAVILLPHLGKAFTIDDTIFLFEARHALLDPLHPTAFNILWDEDVERVSQVVPSGPIQAWLLVPALRATDQERVAHGIMLAVLWVGIVASVSLAKRLGLGPGGMTLVGLLVAASPTVLAMTGTAMPDVTVMTLGTAGMERLVAWQQERRRHQVAAAVLLLGLAPLARSHGLLLLGVAAILLFWERPIPARWRDRLLRLWPVAAAGAVMLAIVVVTRDRGPEAGNVVSAAAGLSSASTTRLSKNLAAFFVHWVLTVTFAVPWVALRWREMVRSRLVLGAAVLGMALAAYVARTRGSNFYWSLVPVAGVGAAALVDVFREARSRGRLQDLALACWLLIGLVALPYVQLPSKYLVASAPAAAILLARVAGRARGLVPRVALGVTLVVGAALGLAIIRADAALSGMSKAAVEKLIVPRVAAGEKVWFVGHWGFQWYAENAGARPVSLTTQFPSAGDTVVVSATSSPSEKVLKRLRNDFPYAIPLDRMTDTSDGGRVMNVRRKVGFFSNGHGALPWTWSRSPLDEFTVWALVR